ncbi:hypothetical protein [Microbulbifer epialgicus]|uniref:Uncharacterized protein n=1 Tax=Microbulbifer epialgicus TaxID=393907 RepID=A0ABV4P614_9GAMM
MTEMVVARYVKKKLSAEQENTSNELKKQGQISADLGGFELI